eukprot:225951-Amphidinium_carterae.1
MPFSGSVPSMPFQEMRNRMTALIVRRPLSGRVPLTACMTWMPISGSAPAKPFSKIPNSVTALMVWRPPSGRVP